ncbi:DUF3378 domain-containing protein [Bacillus sonorensis]|nr:DUF3378 domain-containing protein [Bacillus sonorensis]
MSHSVLKVPQSVIERMKSYYASDITSLSVQGAVFQAKPEGCTITAYQSGKVLFQGKTPQRKLNAGQHRPKPRPTKNRRKAAHPFRLSAAGRYRLHVCHRLR